MRKRATGPLPKEGDVLHLKDFIRTPEFEKQFSQLIDLAPDAEMWVVDDVDRTMEMFWLKPYDKPQVDRDGATYSCGADGRTWQDHFKVLKPEDE